MARYQTLPSHTVGCDSYNRQYNCLHQIFETQADTYPNQVALIGEGQSISYGELEWNVNRLARFLTLKGVGRGSRVGLLLEWSLNVYVALLAILKAGAAYVPVDPDYPTDRVRYILTDSAVQALVTTTSLASQHALFDCDLICLDTCANALLQESAQRLLGSETDVKASDLCYTIYTSGLTGRPKGVEIEHRSACNFVRAISTVYWVEPEDRVYQGFSIAFDASVEEVWIAFSTGATLIVGAREMVQSGASLARLLTEAGVTVLSCVPTLLSMLEEDIPTVRLLILGGEVYPQELGFCHKNFSKANEYLMRMGCKYVMLPRTPANMKLYVWI